MPRFGLSRQQDSVAYLPQHFVLELMPVTSGARSFVQAHSLAITLTLFATSLIVSTKCTKNEPKRFVFLFSCWCKSTRTWWLHHLHTTCAMTSWSQVALVHPCKHTNSLLRSLRSLRVLLSPPNAQKTNQNGSFFSLYGIYKTRTGGNTTCTLCVP